MASLYSQVCNLITEDNKLLVEIACYCYENSSCKLTANEVVKKQVNNTQLRSDILHIVACMRNKNNPVLPQLAEVVNVLRGVIYSVNI
jgi:hypothetical protein